MSDIIDISVPLRSDLPTWPTSPGWDLQTDAFEVEGDTVTNSHLVTDLHVGTHVEAPRHFLSVGACIDDIGLEPFVGAAWIVDVGDAMVVDADVLNSAKIPAQTQRLLVRTSNSSWWPASTDYRDDYVGLDESAADWCVARRLRLVGIDYLSIQSARATAETHRILMRANIAVLEGLDLSAVGTGAWELICLPISLVGVEAAPARAILRHVEDEAR